MTFSKLHNHNTDNTDNTLYLTCQNLTCDVATDFQIFNLLQFMTQVTATVLVYGVGYDMISYYDTQTIALACDHQLSDSMPLRASIALAIVEVQSK